MIRHLFAAVLVAIATLPAARAAEPDPAITETIDRQIAAFLENDLPRAFSFASPMIQGLFGHPDRFGEMVQNGYPMVWRPGSVEYLEQEGRNGAVYQRVLIVDRQGVPHVLDYRMRPGPDGWRIDGVEILAAPPVGA